MPTEHGWFSAYLYFDADIYGDVCDRLITSMVEPFVRRALAEGWAERFFFIRYRERAAHVRLRLYGPTELHDSALKPALDDASDGRVAWVAYEPETDRYGGPEALPVAESFFQSSSWLAFDVLKKLQPSDRSSRLAKALIATLVLTQVFMPTSAEASTFLDAYGSTYLWLLSRSDETARAEARATFDAGFDRQAEGIADLVSDVWDRLGCEESLTPELDRYRGELDATRMSLTNLGEAGLLYAQDRPARNIAEAFRWIVPSYVHMTNNRLGITVREEAYVAHLITKTLGAVHAA